MIAPRIQPLLTVLLSAVVPTTLLIFFFEINVFKHERQKEPFDYLKNQAIKGFFESLAVYV